MTNATSVSFRPHMLDVRLTMVAYQELVNMGIRSVVFDIAGEEYGLTVQQLLQSSVYIPAALHSEVKIIEQIPIGSQPRMQYPWKSLNERERERYIFEYFNHFTFKPWRLEVMKFLANHVKAPMGLLHHRDIALSGLSWENDETSKLHVDDRWFSRPGVLFVTPDSCQYDPPFGDFKAKPLLNNRGDFHEVRIFTDVEIGHGKRKKLMLSTSERIDDVSLISSLDQLEIRTPTRKHYATVKNRIVNSDPPILVLEVELSDRWAVFEFVHYLKWRRDSID